MKRFKIIDLRVSIMLMCIAVICIPFNPMLAFITGYFITGGWQIISMVVHFANNWFCEKGSARYIYHKAIVIICIILLASFLVGNILSPVFMITLVGFAILLFAAPLMAIYYTYLCYQEIRIRMQRPLAQLK